MRTSYGFIRETIIYRFLIAGGFSVSDLEHNLKKIPHITGTKESPEISIVL